jgi:hypothetical protein
MTRSDTAAQIAEMIDAATAREMQKFVVALRRGRGVDTSFENAVASLREQLIARGGDGTYAVPLSRRWSKRVVLCKLVCRRSCVRKVCAAICNDGR